MYNFEIKLNINKTVVHCRTLSYAVVQYRTISYMTMTMHSLTRTGFSPGLALAVLNGFAKIGSLLPNAPTIAGCHDAYIS